MTFTTVPATPLIVSSQPSRPATATMTKMVAVRTTQRAALLKMSPEGHLAVELGGAPRRAIQALGGTPVVRCERCYSPGTDYLLGRLSVIVTERAHQTTSTYQARYRDLLRRQGRWRRPARRTRSAR